MDVKKQIGIKNYTEYVESKMPKSKVGWECLRAFLVGGGICVVGQLVRTFAMNTLALDENGTACFTSMVMIFLGAFLTGLGVYDILGKFAGAGSIVPITGFANSIVAPAMEFKREGFILGVGAKLFSVAGPVLVYGISASVLAGLIYCACAALGWIA